MSKIPHNDVLNICFIELIHSCRKWDTLIKTDGRAFPVNLDINRYHVTITV